MTSTPNTQRQLNFKSIYKGLCPSCNQGKVTQGLFGIPPNCTVCGYNFHPENGFYLGAMAVSFFIAAALLIPPLIILKVLNADVEYIVLFPFVEFMILGPLLFFYSRILWLHLEYKVTGRLDGHG